MLPADLLSLPLLGWAILGFAVAWPRCCQSVLLAVAMINLVWVPQSVIPASAGVSDLLDAMRLADLIVMLRLYAAYPAGLAFS